MKTYHDIVARYGKRRSSAEAKMHEYISCTRTSAWKLLSRRDLDRCKSLAEGDLGASHLCFI